MSVNVETGSTNLEHADRLEEWMGRVSKHVVDQQVMIAGMLGYPVDGIGPDFTPSQVESHLSQLKTYPPVKPPRADAWMVAGAIEAIRNEDGYTNDGLTREGYAIFALPLLQRINAVLDQKGTGPRTSNPSLEQRDNSLEKAAHRKRPSLLAFVGKVLLRKERDALFSSVLGDES